MGKYDEKKILRCLEIVSNWQPSLENADRAIERVRKTLTEAQPRHAVSDKKKQRTVKQLIGFAVAAMVIIVAVLIGLSVFTSSWEEPARDVAKRSTTYEAEEAKIALDARLIAEAEKIRKMAAVGDIEGLIAMLSDGLYESKVSAAYYLGKISDMRAIPALAMLSEQWQGDEFEDPFAAASEEILSRFAVEQEGIEAEPNIVTEKTEAVTKAQRTFSLLVINKQTKEPIPDVELEIKFNDDKSKNITDKQGSCVINLSEKDFGYFGIQAIKDGFVPAEFFYNRPEARTELPGNYTLFLEPGVPVGGFILNEQGQPIEGAAVRLRLPGSDIIKPFGIGEAKLTKWELQPAITDTNGFWRFNECPNDADEFWIRLWHPDYVYETVAGTKQDPAMEELRNMTSVMVMRRGFTVSGQVLNLGGQPIKGARIIRGSTRFIDAERIMVSTNTDDQGKFRFINADPGKMTLTVKADGFAPALKQIIVHKDTLPVEFRLESGSTIRGQIVDSENKPVAGALVTANRWQGHRSIDWQSKADDSGYFEWDNAPEGEVLFNITKAGYMSICDFPIVRDNNEYAIEMYPPLRISGKVTDAKTGELIDNFKLIHMIDWGSTPLICPVCGKADCQEQVPFYPFTNSRYELSFDHPANAYRFRIEADGYIPVISRSFALDEGNVVFDFELQKGTGPAGTVYLPDGRPAAEAQVILCTPSKGVSVSNGRIVEEIHTQFIETDTDGRFTFPPQVETYLLAVLHDQGYAEITAEQLQNNPDIMIEPWGRVEGTLYIGSELGADIEIFMSYTKTGEANTPQFDYEYIAETDADGSFKFDWVPPRKVQIGRLLRLSSRVTSTSHAVGVNVELDRTVNITLGGSGQLVYGKVLVPVDYKAPVNWPNAYCSIHSGSLESQIVEQRSYAFKINPDGTFGVEDIPTGTYNLRISLHERLQNRDRSRGECIGQVNYDFVILESDEPLNIGTLELEMK